MRAQRILVGGKAIRPATQLSKASHEEPTLLMGLGVRIPALRGTYPGSAGQLLLPRSRIYCRGADRHADCGRRTRPRVAISLIAGIGACEYAKRGRNRWERFPKGKEARQRLPIPDAAIIRVDRHRGAVTGVVSSSATGPADALRQSTAVLSQAQSPGDRRRHRAQSERHCHRGADQRGDEKSIRAS